MTSYTLRQHIAAFQESSSPDRLFFKYIFLLARGHERIHESLSSCLSAKSRTLFHKRQHEARDSLNELREQTDAFPFGQVFHEVHELAQKLDEVIDVFQGDEEVFLKLKSDTLAFYKALEYFVRVGADLEFVALIARAKDLHDCLVNARKTFQTISNALVTKPSAVEHMQPLSLSFERTTTYRSVIDKLKALETVYDELCVLADVAEENNTLSILKLEARPLWLYVEGDKHVMDMLEALFERFVTFWFRQFPAQKKLTLPSELIINTQSLIDLSDVLEKAGITFPPSQLDDVKRAALAIQRAFLMMLAGEPTLHLNDTKHAIETAARARYIHESTRYLDQTKGVVYSSNTAYAKTG